MKILSFSDIHGHISNFKKISDEIKLADIVVLSGDITHFGKEPEVQKILNEIRKYNKNIIGVTGNCDYPEVQKVLIQEGLSIHSEGRVIDSYFFAGCGYSLITPFNTPSEVYENDLEKYINKAYSNHKDENSVFVVHQPPYNSKTDILKSGEASGSKIVRKFIETKKPVLCLTGHIHESPAIEHLDDTVLINPGGFFEGSYASVEIDGKIVINSEIKKI
ncbi:MAG: hypothetical protein GY714_23905 [Desulfobacterales bacterium]|nr:hypothetical protein [Desulfobacterales bacterium]MCP4160918.1 hypothetical protein [Deltaproteobacteria bacterium]